MDYNEVLKPAGSAMEGVNAALQFTPWDDTADPDVASYVKAVETYTTSDPRSGNIQVAYAEVMWLYEIAKHVGFDKLDSTAIAKVTGNETGLHIPLSRQLVNPGPADYPQVKQPYVRIVEWKHGHLEIVENGTDEGWVKAY
jgi:hypothetical protein